jgi:hypothetical protein
MLRAVVAINLAAPLAVRFSIGQSIADSFRVLKRNFMLFVIPALAFRLIWLLVPLFDRAGTLVGTMSWTDDVAKPLLGIISAGLIESAVAFGTLQSLRGRGASLSDVKRGLRSFVAVTVAGVVFCAPGMAASLVLGVVKYLIPADQSSIGILIMIMAALLLAIAVTIIATAWFVYGPAIIFERKGVVEGLVRNAELTKGRRWAIFGIGFILVVISLIALAPVSLLADVKFAELLSPTKPSISGAIGYVQAIAHTFSAILIIVVYRSLRAEKERITDEAIVASR